MIRSKELHREDLVWSRGWEQWRKIQEVEVFAPILDELDGKKDESQFPEEQEAQPPPLTESSFEEPKPWLRFWARFMDYTLYLFALGIVVGLVFPSNGLLMHLAQSPASQIFLNVILFLLYAPLEAIMLSKTGKTPGKAFLGIRMESELGGLPTFKQALFRSLTVCIRGVFFWMPLASLIAMFFSRLRLIQYGKTVWDEEAQTFLIQKPIPAWRIGILIFLVVVVLILFTLSYQATQLLLEHGPAPERK